MSRLNFDPQSPSSSFTLLASASWPVSSSTPDPIVNGKMIPECFLAS